MKKLFFILFILFTVIGLGVEARVNKGHVNKNIKLDSWLFLGPVTPEIIKDNKVPVKENLDYEYIDVSRLVPEKGQKIVWNKNIKLKWRLCSKKQFRFNEDKILYFATYLKTDRWLNVKLILNTTSDNVKVFLNGKYKKSITKNDISSTELKLSNKKHLLLIKVIVKKNNSFTFKPFIKFTKFFNNAKLISTISKKHRVDIKNILNMNNINSISLSSNGKYVKVELSKTNQYTEKTKRWTEILNVSNGNKLLSSENIGHLNQFRWLKSSEKFTYTKSNNDLTSIYIYNLNNRTQKVILSDIKNFSSYWWSPDSAYIVYSTSKLFGNNKNFNNIKKLPLRAKNSGFKFAYHIVYINKTKYGFNSTNHNLFSYDENYDNILISPDSNKILMTKLIEDYSHRPYQKFTVSMLNLRSDKKTKMIGSYWVNNVVWSPDSTKLLMIGGPSSFNGIGNTLSKNIIPNDFDGQIFLFDLKTKKAISLSKKFVPSISSVYWYRTNTIYLKAIDRSYSRFYRYNIKNKTFKKINTKVDVIQSIALSKKYAVFSGSSTTKPPKLYSLNLSSHNISLIKDYNKKMFKNVIFGKCKDWNFKTSNGKTIKGRIYYPTNFSKHKKYPCIVYYYGGTSPVTREYGGRYPKNWYAANGYIVYILQPTGTVGFGQKSSSVHVNDWGLITSKEIIEGIKQLIKKHSYIDPKKIGSMGASYGGFLTQYLATQTDIISAFISHAGISSLSSYWGIGDWGYSYSGIASANSLPWNRKDLYVGHSPLYMVDRIKNPILLLHGDIDNNVPPGESYQMYAALKLAGKRAALITFKGQEHFILEYAKRKIWMETIIAWFDKWLKNEPEHWADMYDN